MSQIIKRFGQAVWKGGLKEGSGVITTQSKMINNMAYGVPSRFGEGQVEKNTNPEELIAAAHASCYSMALSAQLGTVNLVPKQISTTANLSMVKDAAGWTITEINLKCVAQVPGATKEVFAEKAKLAKEGCPVSKVLNCNITLDAQLE